MIGECDNVIIRKCDNGIQARDCATTRLALALVEIPKKKVNFKLKALSHYQIIELSN
jgi:hypothetical protein